MSGGGPAPAHPAATVVLLREEAEELEVLLLRRNSKLAFHGGAWVFPGGRIDPDDFAAAGGELPEAARVAAAREAYEEARVVITPDALIPVSRWVTPEIRPKRFDTFFFAAAARTGEAVQVDGGEILDHRWTTPTQAMASRARGEIELPPPTFVTLLQLEAFRRPKDALSALTALAPREFRPRVRAVEGGILSLYSGDVAFDSGEIEQAGPRHRLWMLESGWRYESPQ